MKKKRPHTLPASTPRKRTKTLPVESPAHRRAEQDQLLKQWLAEAEANEKTLKVAPTRLPDMCGLGLFATVDLPVLSFLAEYRGQPTTKAALDLLYGDDDDVVAPYGMTLSDGRIIDAGDPHASSLARYANDCTANTRAYMESLATASPGTQKLRNNAAFVEVRGRLFLRAIYKIRAGDEIYVSYGEDYWGTTKQQIRGAILRHLSGCPRRQRPAPLVSAAASVTVAAPEPRLVQVASEYGQTLDQIVAGVADQVRLILGDSKRSIEQVTEEVNAVLLAERQKTVDLAMIGSVADLYFVTPIARQRYRYNLARETGSLTPELRHPLQHLLSVKAVSK